MSEGPILMERDEHGHHIVPWPPQKSRADELSDKLRLVRDALSLDLGDGVDVVDGARRCREERDRLALENAALKAEIARFFR